MLIGEYDYDTDIAVQRQESLMIGIRQGIERGKSLGLAEGEARGSRQKALETAKNLIDIGLSTENISKATGLRRDEIEKL